MKKICTLLTAVLLAIVTQAQVQTRTATASRQTTVFGENWGIANRSGAPTTIDTFHTAFEFTDSVYGFAGLDFTTVTEPGQGKADTASEYMILTGFGFTIPEDMRIGRIAVTFWGRSGGDTPVIFIRDVKLIRNLVEEPELTTDPEPGFVSFFPVATTQGLRSDSALRPGEGEDTAVVVAGAPSIWTGNGGLINPEDVNNSEFGVAFRIVNTHPLDEATGYIDSVSITITYEAQANLPVTFVSVSARQVSNGTQVVWKVADEIDVREYEVERSDDGSRFNRIGSVPAEGKDTYTFTDVQPVKGVAFYRVRNVDLNGDFKYSTIISFRNGGSLVITRAYPLPVRGALTLQHGEAARQSVITVSSLDGKLVKTQRPSAGSVQTDIDLSGVQAGVYLLRYEDGRGKMETLKIIKQ